MASADEQESKQNLINHRPNTVCSGVRWPFVPYSTNSGIESWLPVCLHGLGLGESRGMSPLDLIAVIYIRDARVVKKRNIGVANPAASA
jgi:hypothetical protein